MKATQFVSLETIPLDQQQAILYHFGHPYAPPYKGNLMDDKNLSEKDIVLMPFEVDNQLLPRQKTDCNQKQQKLSSETFLNQFEFDQLNESKLNLVSDSERVLYFQKLQIASQCYNRGYKAKQNS
jgi:hypothetical protein